jgi:hypothetical protein
VPTPEGLSLETPRGLVPINSDEQLRAVVQDEIKDLGDFIRSTGIDAEIAAKVQGRELQKRGERRK